MPAPENSHPRPSIPEDPYSRVDYRRLIAWPRRLEAEAPFLRRILERAPERSVLDLGCGTGEHSRHLAACGFRVVGLDRSESMIARAVEEPCPPNLRFVQGDLVYVDDVTEESFGAAISLGNTLVHVTGEEELRRALAGLRRRLHPGGIFLFQILNYERIFSKGIRYLPLSFRPGTGEGEEIIFLRVMEPLEDGRLLFFPTTLVLRSDGDPPIRVERAKRVEVRGWRLAQLRPLLEEAGLRVRSVHGDMQGGLYDAMESQDLVVVAGRPG